MTTDLHMHSTASDGLDTPAQLVEKCLRVGLRLISLTDHDSIGGVSEAIAAGKKCGIRVIPGVELSTGGVEELHILGYGIKDLSSMGDFLVEMRASRKKRLYSIAEKLHSIGIEIDPESIIREAGETVGRPHVARALINLGYANNVQDAFTRYLAPGRPGYVARKKFETKDAISIVRDAGGIAVLAHPCISIKDNFFLPERVKELRGYGLVGLEVYHPGHNISDNRLLEKIALENGLLITGGSDFHGTAGSSLKQGLDNWKTENHDVEALLRAIDR